MYIKGANHTRTTLNEVLVSSIIENEVQFIY